MKNDDQRLKLNILERALTISDSNGWNDNLLIKAGRDVGVDEAIITNYFPRGLVDLTDFFFAEINRKTLLKLTKSDLAAMPIRQRVAFVIRKRLELMIPYRQVVRMILSTYLRPRFVCDSARNTYLTVDFIWRVIGDKSTDFNFYTKRALLVPVLVTTLLFWLNDESVGFEDTWAFLNRRIGDVLKIQKLRGRLDKIVSRVPFISAVFSTVRSKKMA